MSAEDVRVETNAGDPIRNQAGVLPSRHAASGGVPTREQKFARPFAGGCQIVIDSLSGLLGQFKPNGMTGFLLANRCSIGCIAIRCNILDFQSNNVAAAKLTVDCQIEHRKISCSSLQL